MGALTEEELGEALSRVLLVEDEGVVEGLDSDLVSYLAGMLSEGFSTEQLLASGDDTQDAIHPFLESAGCDESLVKQACEAVHALAQQQYDSQRQANHGAQDNLIDSMAVVVGESQNVGEDGGARKLRQGVVSMASDLTAHNEAEADATRYMWGQDNKVSAMTNAKKEAYTVLDSAKERRKQKQELGKTRKEYEEKVRVLEEEDEQEGAAAVSAMVLPDYRSGRNEKDIQVRNVMLSLDNGRAIMDSGEIRFAYRRRYGLVGPNGVGKTTLLKAIAGMTIEGFPRHHRVLHVRQEIKAAGTDDTVLQAVLDADVERNALLKEERELTSRLEQTNDGDTNSNEISMAKKRLELQKKLTSESSLDGEFEKDLKRLDEVYARLNVLSSDSAESRAAMILSGLQFTTDMQSGPTSALSGGWRMRVALAAALFIEPDLLLLDEPTNHLDLEAVLWLESYLVEYRHTLVVVSHDRGFLNQVCTDIIQFKDLKLHYYKGDYDTFVRTSDENVKNLMRVYQAYQDKRAHMMEFIDKFRTNAKRATLVQSRIKAVEKMDVAAPEPVEVPPIWRFSIPNPEPLGRPIIAVDDVTFDYNTSTKPESEYLLQKVNFGVDLSSRIGILGPNGCGKSTLLNLIMGKLEPHKGSISKNGRLRIGYFTQHSADKFDLQLSAVENMMNIFEKQKVGDQEMRSFLGRFQIQGTEALKPMLMLSGGQKSRVAFASLAFQQPHVIIMDEPTNHLDMESIDALVEAIKDFRGGLMVVSHDQFFITNTCSELWVVGEYKATRFRGDFNEYRTHTLAKTAKRVADSVKMLSTINNN